MIAAWRLFDTLHASQRLRDEAGQSQDAAETIADVIGAAESHPWCGWTT